MVLLLDSRNIYLCAGSGHVIYVILGLKTNWHKPSRKSVVLSQNTEFLRGFSWFISSFGETLASKLALHSKIG